MEIKKLGVLGAGTMGNGIALMQPVCEFRRSVETKDEKRLVCVESQ